MSTWQDYGDLVALCLGVFVGYCWGRYVQAEAEWSKTRLGVQEKRERERGWWPR